MKIVGARSFENYVSGLQQVLPSEKLTPRSQPRLADLLKKDSRLFSKEIEIMYDLDQNQVSAFIEKEINLQDYQQKQILGELYLEKK